MEPAPSLRRIGGNDELSDASLSGALNRLLLFFSAAARDHPDQVFHDVEDLLPQHFPIKHARILLNAGDKWNFWREPTDPHEAVAVSADAIDPASKPGSFMHLPNEYVFFTVRPGEIGLIVYEAAPGAVDALSSFAVYVEAVLAGIWPGSTTFRQKIITAFSRVATTILHSDDLTEIFFNITEVAKNELAADISGIMLLEGDQLVMQRCVGNLSSRTEKLNMAAGQGIGGRVLQTGKPCVVEDYVASSMISQDFFDLARVEKVRSALAVPLLKAGQTAGVLEVWRRRPSSFSEENVTELETLSQLASLAIANANLFAAQKRTLRDLEKANAKIRERADVIEFSSGLQRKLVDCVLEGLGIEDIVKAAADASGTSVYVLDEGGLLRTQFGRDRLPKRDVGKLQLELAAAPRSKEVAISVKLGPDKSTLVCQRMSAVSGQGGWVCLLEPVQQSERCVMALSAISVSIALHDMKSQAAFAAMSEKITSLVWDLLDAPENIRRLAVERLSNLEIDLTDKSCVIICSLRDRDRGAARPSVAESDLELRLSLAQSRSSPRHLRSAAIPLVSMRGEEIAVVLPWKSKRDVEKVASDLERQVSATAPDFACDIGISSVCSDPLNLADALRQARLARKVARQSRLGKPVHFEELGLVGMMMGFKDGISFDDFGDRTLGALAADTAQAATLRMTLDCFLTLNCHQSQTADALGVHPKTVAYRIERCQELTGLDLNSHEVRVLLSLALKAHELGVQEM